MNNIKYGEFNIMYEHVYCTECKYGEELIESIANEIDMSIICEKCYPYNPEDSKPFYMRSNYILKENEVMKSQTENYIILKPIAERFNKIANSITDDEIKSLIKDEMREQLKQINFSSQIEEIIFNYIDNNQEDMLDLYKQELKNKFK